MTLTPSELELLPESGSKLEPLIVAVCANGPPCASGAVRTKLAAVLLPTGRAGRWQLTFCPEAKQDQPAPPLTTPTVKPLAIVPVTTTLPAISGPKFRATKSTSKDSPPITSVEPKNSTLKSALARKLAATVDWLFASCGSGSALLTVALLETTVPLGGTVLL